MSERLSTSREDSLLAKHMALLAYPAIVVAMQHVAEAQTAANRAGILEDGLAQGTLEAVCSVMERAYPTEDDRLDIESDDPAQQLAIERERESQEALEDLAGQSWQNVEMQCLEAELGYRRYGPRPEVNDLREALNIRVLD